jgi:hypothetical protein
LATKARLAFQHAPAAGHDQIVAKGNRALAVSHKDGAIVENRSP